MSSRAKTHTLWLLMLLLLCRAASQQDGLDRQNSTIAPPTSALQGSAELEHESAESNFAHLLKHLNTSRLIDETPGAAQPLVGAKLFTALLSFAAVASLMLCFYFAYGWVEVCRGQAREEGGEEDEVQLVALEDGLTKSEPSSRESSSKFGDRLRQRLNTEAKLLILAPWVSLSVGVTVASFIGHVPPALYVMAVPLVIRCFQQEVSLLHDKGESLSGSTELAFVCEFLLSKLEVVDGVGDGLAIASAFFLDAEAYYRLLASFQGVSAVLVPVLHLTRGLGGLSVLVMLFASYVQISVLSSDNLAVPADLAGFGLLATRLDNVGGSHGRMRLIGLSRVLAEAAPQMLIQTSLIMARGGGVFKRPTVLISVVLSFAGTCKRTLGLMKAVVADREPCVSASAAGALCADVVGALCASLLLLLILCRLYFMEICPSGMWGLTTGCVVML
eukprot:CAMPEP_0115584778 /NCGR_PEP_ID=MMETSP0272-20121206/6858_1 /TAXON_ID=71861 /ORGANISM="Scrippsiella trochoidea, Strain CCMP3099" /LENGTH=445 /DNA_ID=CAMNT_0003019821 /DNA_START=1 /DNA_END=1338 /DNA_ORIENTATION=-